MITNRLVLIVAMLAAASASFADVAPDPGYTRVSSNLVLESDTDLSGFRFFLESPAGVEETKVNSGTPTRIDAAGRGGAARYAKLIAVPAVEITQRDAEEIARAIRQKRYPGAKELISHNFQVTIPEREKDTLTDPVYRVTVDGGQISATPVAVERPEGTRLTYSIWQLVWPVAIAGSLLAGGVAVMGVWLLRRRSEKAV